MSHCIGASDEVSVRKRMLLAALGLNGISCWLDLLDTSESPEPDTLHWQAAASPHQQATAQALATSAKVVTMVDKAYLCSFACLQVCTPLSDWSE